MKVIKLKEVMSLTGLSKTSIYKFAASNSFPKPIPLGGRAVGWIESEVQSWIESRIRLRDEVAA